MDQHTEQSTVRSAARSRTWRVGVAATALAAIAATGLAGPALAAPATPAPAAVAPAATTTVPVTDAAYAYLQARSAKDYTAAWNQLALVSKQEYGSRAAFNKVVKAQSPVFTSLLASDPQLTVRGRGPSTTGHVAVFTGVTDPVGSPRAVAVSILFDAAGRVVEAPSTSYTAASWENPSVAQGGSLGIAFYDPAQPLRVRVAPGYGVESISTGDGVVEATQDPTDPTVWIATPNAPTGDGLDAATVTFTTSDRTITYVTSVLFEQPTDR